MIENWSFFARFILTTVCFLVYVLFLTPKQFHEVLRPVDWLTKMRWWILGLLLMTTITLVPSIIYQYFIATGHEYKVLRNIVSIIGGITLVVTTILMVLVFTYRKKND